MIRYGAAKLKKPSKVDRIAGKNRKTSPVHQWRQLTVIHLKTMNESFGHVADHCLNSLHRPVRLSKPVMNPVKRNSFPWHQGFVIRN